MKFVKLNPKAFKGTEWYKYVKYKYFTIMFIPVVLYYIIFKYIPISGLLLAFKDFRFRLGIWGSPWVGVSHFISLFGTPSFWEVFKNTIVISIYKLAWGFPMPILFALLLNELYLVKFKKVVQTISYLPHFISWVVLGGLFTQFLSPSIGPINILLKNMGFTPIYFLADEHWFRAVLVSTSIWQSIGWSSIIYLAALTGINPELYEAAMVDGANRLKRVIYITLPSLVPVITIMLIFAVGKLVTDDFEQIFNLYNEAVYSVGDVIGTYVYRKGIIDSSYEFATAVGLFQNLIAFCLIVITNKLAKTYSEYGIW